MIRPIKFCILKYPRQGKSKHQLSSVYIKTANRDRSVFLLHLMHTLIKHWHQHVCSDIVLRQQRVALKSMVRGAVKGLGDFFYEFTACGWMQEARCAQRRRHTRGWKISARRRALLDQMQPSGRSKVRLLNDMRHTLLPLGRPDYNLCARCTGWVLELKERERCKQTLNAPPGGRTNESEPTPRRRAPLPDTGATNQLPNFFLLQKTAHLRMSRF